MSGILKIQLLRDTSKPPVRATSGAAAYDLFADIDGDITIQPGETAKIPTGIAIELEHDHLVALVFSRSGHGYKNGVSLVNSVGVIDSDYRGEIIVGMINHGEQPFTVHADDRVAQLLITTAFLPEIVVCDTLSDSDRGTKGFGSTGS